MRGHSNGESNDSDFATVSGINRRANLQSTVLDTTELICLNIREVTLDLLKATAPTSAPRRLKPAHARLFTKSGYIKAFSTEKGANQRRKCQAKPTLVRAPAARLQCSTCVRPARWPSCAAVLL